MWAYWLKLREDNIGLLAGACWIFDKKCRVDAASDQREEGYDCIWINIKKDEGLNIGKIV